MNSLKSLLFLFSTFILVQCNRRIRHANHESLEREHTLRVQQLNTNWTCGEPRPRLVYLDDPANDNGWVAEPNVLWLPDVAVIHRCDRTTGCCHPPSFTCKPLTTTRVQIVFHRRDMHRGIQTYERFAFTNHTRCGCEQMVHNPAEL